MKWYKRYPGDYGNDTRHLTLTEIGAYDMLLDHYYTKEAPLPTALPELYLIAKAQKAPDKRAVQKVVSEFFPTNGDGLRHNKRADEEIAKAKATSVERARAGSKGGSK